MRIRPLALGAVALALALTGCTSIPSGQPAPTPSRDVTATVEPTPTPTPTPIEDTGTLVVMVDGLEYGGAADSDFFPYYDPEQILALIEGITGQPRVGTDVEGPYGGYWSTHYGWDGVVVDASKEGGPAFVTVTAPTLAGVEIATAEGITVGTDLETARDAGAWDGGDWDQDGEIDLLGLGGTVVPGTRSLSRPGEEGIEYVGLNMESDVVAQIFAPGNDFSDI